MNNEMWRKILKYRDKAKPLHKMEVRSGLATSFWHDNWCSLGRLADVLGPRGSIDMGIATNCSVAAALSNHRRRRHRYEMLNRVEDELDSLRSHSLAGKDISLWKRNNGSFKGTFSSKDTWYTIRDTNPVCEWYKGVWFPHSTPKYSFITWIAIRNRLATGDRLLQWNAAANGACNLCDGNIETREHLFFSCPYSSHVWSALTRDMLGQHYTTRWETLLPLLTAPSTSKLHLFVLRYVFQISIHSLWRERNGRRHGESPTPASMLAKLIDKNVRNRLSTLITTGSPTYEGGLRYWFQTHSR